MKLIYSCLALFCYFSSVTVSASLEPRHQLGECEEVHRVPSPDGYGCGDCISGYVESDNYRCIPGLAGCSPWLDCETLHREPCDEYTKGRCGYCADPHIEIAGVCISEKGADRAIRTLEDLLAIRLKEKSEAIQQKEGDRSVIADNSGNKLAVLPEKASQSEASPPSPAPGILEGDQQAEKRVANDKMADHLEEGVSHKKTEATIGFSKLVFFCIITGVTLVCIISIVFAGVCWYRLHKVRKSMQPAEYRGYGGSHKGSIARSESGSRKLAHSAQMYHYKHQKEQMALESSLSDRLEESEGEIDENEEGSYTVYECPGLAPAGEMEVSNPLFHAASRNSPSSVSSPGSFTSPPPSMVTSDEGDN